MALVEKQKLFPNPRPLRHRDAAAAQQIGRLGLQSAEKDEQGIVEAGIIDPASCCEAWLGMSPPEVKKSHHLRWRNYKLFIGQMEHGFLLQSQSSRVGAWRNLHRGTGAAGAAGDPNPNPQKSFQGFREAGLPDSQIPHHYEMARLGS